MSINRVSVEKAQKLSITRACATCSATDKKLSRCARCNSVFYCNVECQRKDWPKHREVCRKPTSPPSTQTNSSTSTKKIGAHPFIPPLYILNSTTDYSTITEEQINDAESLLSIPLNSILDRGETEAYVKRLGQIFFDKYANGLSEAGEQAVKNICNWLASNKVDSERDAKLRKEYVSHAWNGIGDQRWRWIV